MTNRTVEGPHNRCAALGCIRPTRYLNNDHCESCQKQIRDGMLPSATRRRLDGRPAIRQCPPPRRPAAPTARICGVCGSCFTAKGTTVYCSSACKVEGKRRNHRAQGQRKRANGTKWVEQPVTQPCVTCGVAVTRLRRSTLKSDPVCGSCRRDARLTGQSTKLPWSECPSCLRTWLDRKGRRFCSDSCVTLNEARTSKLHYGNCLRCGGLFVGRLPGGKWCSSRCGKAARKRHRKHLERAGHRSEGMFTMREIAERDGWRCHLCDRKVPDRRYTGRALDPTIDHIVPLSSGGEHARANVALAHFRCNSLRSNVGPAQQRLFG